MKHETNLSSWPQIVTLCSVVFITESLCAQLASDLQRYPTPRSFVEFANALKLSSKTDSIKGKYVFFSLLLQAKKVPEALPSSSLAVS
jgi:hypothetical protein